MHNAPMIPGAAHASVRNSSKTWNGGHKHEAVDAQQGKLVGSNLSYCAAARRETYLFMLRVQAIAHRHVIRMIHRAR